MDSASDTQLSLLRTPIGETGSGSKRYAAAMYFFNQNKITAELLEIYRRCSILDHEDPIDLARFEGVDPVEIDLSNPK